MSKYREIGEKVIALTEEKDPAYGYSVMTCGEILKHLFPDGIKPEQYRKAAVMVRIIDKLKRWAVAEEAFGERPAEDIMGYCLVYEVAGNKVNKGCTICGTKCDMFSVAGMICRNKNYSSWTPKDGN